jgi:hypothetical protein
MSRPGFELGPPAWDASTRKEPSRQLVNSYSKLFFLYMSLRQFHLNLKLFQVDIDANGDEVKYTEVSWLDLVAKEAARLRQVKRNSPTFLHEFSSPSAGDPDPIQHFLQKNAWFRIQILRVRMPSFAKIMYSKFSSIFVKFLKNCKCCSHKKKVKK